MTPPIAAEFQNEIDANHHRAWLPRNDAIHCLPEIQARVLLASRFCRLWHGLARLAGMLAGLWQVRGRVTVPVLFNTNPDQNCKHNEADDPFFLSCKNKHQVRRGFT